LDKLPDQMPLLLFAAIPSPIIPLILYSISSGKPAPKSIDPSAGKEMRFGPGLRLYSIGVCRGR